MNEIQHINYFTTNENVLYNKINSMFSLREEFTKDKEIEKYNLIQLINRSFNKFTFWDTFIQLLNCKTVSLIKENTIQKNMCKVVCNQNMYNYAIKKNQKYYNEYLHLMSVLQNL